ncbi:MAG: hypothetical protein JXL84_23190 [Deltaproteobacteria bacterium]|nr:hypothetical protein [Deltaproteobacteria bacterium]
MSIISPKKKMAIIASYFAGETYGLLGPQMAATLIEEHTPCECIVVGVDRGDDKGVLKGALSDFFGLERPVIGFSTLSGREDLFDLARELKEEGATTILAGPQADADFLGERDWQSHPHRFPGLSKHFSFALHGPAEQIIPFLQAPDNGAPLHDRGVAFRGGDGKIRINPRKPWDERFLAGVRWGNLYRLERGTLAAHTITLAQVVQHIGCPHASRPAQIEISYPAFLQEVRPRSVKVHLKGCSFCDVATDKGFHGSLGWDGVLKQVQGLPELEDGRKIAFELINENPLPGLPHLLREAEGRGLQLSQVNLTMRADWFVQGEAYVREALRMARRMRVRVLLSSVGFESFDDGILRNLNKGVTVETNLQAIRLLRRLKEEFPFQWAYSSAEGAVHGFIHPTPWDTGETANRIQREIERYALFKDVLPEHSVPLIIHHASALGDWMREIERREHLCFERYVSVIGWWKEAVRGPYIN